MEDTITTVAFPTYPTYKDSGVEWLGGIPAGWELSRLGKILTNKSERGRSDLDLLSITREKGVIVRDLDNEEENHNFIPDDLSNYKVLRQGQFGMNKMKAWQGSYGVSPQDGIVSPAYYVFDLDGNLNPRFFHLAIRSKLYISFFGAASDGVRIGQWDLSKERMKNIPFLIPPLPEQTAIANFLDKKTALIDKAIQIKEKQIALLQERRQILIQQAVTRGLDPSVPLKDSGVDWIGMIPEHWEVKRVKHISRKIVDGSHFTPTYVDEGIPFLRVTDLSDPLQEGIDWMNTKKIPLKEHQELIKRANPGKGDILLSKNGTIGLTKVITWDEEFSFFVSLCLIKPLPLVNPYYFSFFFNSPLVDEQITNGASRTSVSNLHLEKIKELLIVLPPLNEQEIMVNHFLSISEKYEKTLKILLKEIEKLKEYKSTLINSAVTGKIKVAGV